jgi:hypothetical protein
LASLTFHTAHENKTLFLSCSKLFLIILFFLESLGFSLRNFANVVIDLAGVNNRTPPCQSPAAPEPPLLKRDRSSRRGAILLSAVKSPASVADGGNDEKSTKNNITERRRKVSKAITDKIYEENDSAPKNINEIDNDDVFKDDDCCEDNLDVDSQPPVEDPTSRYRQRSSLPNMRNSIKKHDRCNNNNIINMNGKANVTEDCEHDDCCENTASNTKTQRSLSETHRTPPRVQAGSPVIRRRRVIHCDEIMFFKPKKLSEHQQRARRKLTHVPNFHMNPTEHLEDETLVAGSESARDESYSPAPWMKMASSSLSEHTGHFSPTIMSPTKESLVIIER